MKKSVFFSFALFLGMAIMAQAPQAFKYQAVARDNSGNVLANKNVSFRISIIQGTVTGAIIYSELHAKTTNMFGLVELEIGKGTSPSGSFAAINWGVDQFFIKVEMDPLGGIAFQNLGTTQLLSVPFALHAKTIEGVTTDASLAGRGIASSPLTVADNGITNAKIVDTAVSSNKLANNAVTSAKMASMGATSGQVLKYNGTAWLPSEDGGSPGGVVGNVQFNGGGTFAGDNNLFWNNTSKRLGIGTNSPTGALDISLNSTTGLPHLMLTETEADYSRFSFKNTSNSTKVWTIAGKTDANDANSLLNFWYFNGTSGEDILSINGKGNVGIGVYNPAYNLSIYGGSLGSDLQLVTANSGTGSSDGLRVGMSGGGANAWVWNNENGKLYFGTNNLERVTILNDGKVGIGTTTPEATLDIEGTVKVGLNGSSFGEIREITGTTSASNNFISLAYPSGYTISNIRVLSLDINYNGTSWVGQGGTDFPTTDIQKIFYFLTTSQIYIYYPNVTAFQGKTFRMLVMKMQ